MCSDIVVSRKIYFITFSWTEVRLTGLWLLRSSFLPFLKTAITFSFLLLLDTSLGCYENSKMTENSLTRTSAGSLWTSHTSMTSRPTFFHHGLYFSPPNPATRNQKSPEDEVNW